MRKLRARAPHFASRRQAPPVGERLLLDAFIVACWTALIVVGARLIG